uniref:FHA domain-containing protein n=1 Tax=Janibacter limosus TaxID=53458 RepID=A0AC61U1S1_9MICO|nr:FHA domain-containing protein [Janibacter limosus]
MTTCGPDAGRTHDLTPGRHTIGRGEAATLRLADDALSREHLELTVDRDGIHLRDLGHDQRHPAGRRARTARWRARALRLPPAGGPQQPDHRGPPSSTRQTHPDRRGNPRGSTRPRTCPAPRRP